MTAHMAAFRRRATGIRSGDVSPAVITALVLIIGLGLAVARSWQLGVDSNWDLLNYHLYKASSILDNSFPDDIAPVGLGTYLNPLIELPTSLAISMFGLRWGMILGAAVVQVACFFSVWRLARELARVDGRTTLQAITAFAVAICGSGAVSLAFTTFGDWIIAALLCEAMLRLLRCSGRPLKPSWVEAVVAGLWIGVAVGLKMTAISLAIGLFVATLVILGWRTLLRVILGAAAGFALIGLPWMVYLQLKYQSPVFPFYNSIFRSDSGPAETFRDSRFGAGTLRAFLEFPVEMFRGTIKYSELLIQDWRFIVLLAMLPMFLVLSPFRPKRDVVVGLPLVTVLASYAVWSVMFGIYRYFLFAEVLTSMLIVVVAFRLISEPRKACAACASLALLGLGFQQAPNWGRDAELRSDELDQIVSELDASPELVAIAGPPPLGYLLAQLPSSTRALSLYSFVTGELTFDGPIAAEIDAAVVDALAAESFFAISDAGATALLPPLDGLTLSECEPFRSNDRDLQFCRATASQSS